MAMVRLLATVLVDCGPGERLVSIRSVAVLLPAGNPGAVLPGTFVQGRGDAVRICVLFPFHCWLTTPQMNRKGINADAGDGGA